AASPSASIRACSWSSARRSTLLSSAYRQAAARIPDWRSAPPSICFQRHASSMSSPDPASTAPTGAPRPLVKSIQAASKPPAYSLAGTLEATTAFTSRAPPTCARSSSPRATAQGDLVGQRAAGQKRRRLVAEQLGDARLERARGGVRSALLVADLRRCHRRAHPLARAGLRVAVQIDGRQAGPQASATLERRRRERR